MEHPENLVKTLGPFSMSTYNSCKWMFIPLKLTIGVDAPPHVKKDVAIHEPTLTKPGYFQARSNPATRTGQVEICEPLPSRKPIRPWNITMFNS